MESIFGVKTSLLPWQPKSAQPRSSARITMTLGFFCSPKTGRQRATEKRKTKVLFKLIIEVPVKTPPPSYRLRSVLSPWNSYDKISACARAFTEFSGAMPSIGRLNHVQHH